MNDFAIIADDVALYLNGIGSLELSERVELSRELITAATELLGEDCKGEIELLQAVHRTLDSKGEL